MQHSHSSHWQVFPLDMHMCTQYTHLYTCTHACIHTCMNTCMHTHSTCMHTYIQTCIHTHACTPALSFSSSPLKCFVFFSFPSRALFPTISLSSLGFFLFPYSLLSFPAPHFSPSTSLPVSGHNSYPDSLWIFLLHSGHLASSKAARLLLQ